MKNFALIISFFLFTTLIKAEGPPLRLSVGAGEIIKSNNRFDNQYSKSKNDPIFNFIPFATLQYGPLNIGGGGISLSLFGNREKAFFLNLNRMGERYYGVNMDQRKDSVFAGFGAKIDQFNFLLTKDINGRSKGLRGQVSWAKMTIFEDESVIRGALNLEFYNQAYANYYYGVKDTEVLSTRAKYSPNAYLVPGASAFYSYRIIPKVNLISIATFKVLPNAVTKSPTTKAVDFETSLIVATTWVFY